MARDTEPSRHFCDGVASLDHLTVGFVIEFGCKSLATHGTPSDISLLAILLSTISGEVQASASPRRGLMLHPSRMEQVRFANDGSYADGLGRAWLWGATGLCFQGGYGKEQPKLLIVMMCKRQSLAILNKSHQRCGYFRTLGELRLLLPRFAARPL